MTSAQNATTGEEMPDGRRADETVIPLGPHHDLNQM